MAFWPGKIGPKQALTDEALLDQAQKDLAAFLYYGDGRCKVWIQLRFGQRLTLSRKRKLRIMFE